ncbi:sigma 54-interacting transcriptional regulator [Fibrobacter sp. UWB5]|uniref:sigma 54-interacting transcriptional regulator n=1 Tax=Fibrobacter sp. UWB5 TaxID=1964360 RepID=UPI000B520DD5|nr:sigma-54 dependent transcriptional regulator [Fibrobacter sp. UWB5]OWV09681.1 Fis family transcriptional regulator [Fibrobacter sp. UWB5]
MNRHESMLRIAASSDISVLLLGESGSGKEVAARFVHAHSKRAGGPFIALNCGAIAKGLTESILEGHRKGAFTGASEERLGVVRSADHGTLFLDEIGEMPFETQCKLLRILQERAVMPLGSCDPLPVDFRLVCATNRDLRAEVHAGRFREDLYFRLNVFPVKIPPLREREDFAAIAQEIWKEIADHNPLNANEIASLSKRKWPGNVRQLKNVLQRYSLLKPYDITLPKLLDEEFFDPTSSNIAEPSRLYNIKSRRITETPEWKLICSELSKNSGNRSITAQKLGISRGCLNYHIKKHQS